MKQKYVVLAIIFTVALAAGLSIILLREMFGEILRLRNGKPQFNVFDFAASEDTIEFYVQNTGNGTAYAGPYSNLEVTGFNETHVQGKFVYGEKIARVALKTLRVGETQKVVISTYVSPHFQSFRVTVEYDGLGHEFYFNR